MGERTSVEFYDRLADTLDEFYAAPHRKAYDDLAWEQVAQLALDPPGVVVDLGCGTGRWARRFLDAGWSYVGIDDAPKMVAEARGRHPHANIVLGSMDDVVLPAQSADLIIAMGSFQYSRDPAALAHRVGTWAKPGGFACVLVDSFLGLVLELLGVGRFDEARERMDTRRSLWTYEGASVEYALLDASMLGGFFRDAGFVDVRAAGLLVGLTGLGRERWLEQFDADPDATLEMERRLAAQPAAADAGKHVLLTARWPSR